MTSSVLRRYIETGLEIRIVAMTKRITAHSLRVYLVTLCPIALLLGMLVDSIGHAARMSPADRLAETATFVLGFLAAGAIGHICATIVLPPVRSKILASRPWAFPIACGIAFSLATATCVENTTDIIGRWVGHAYEDAMVATTATAWSAIATASVIGVDAIICRLTRRG